MQSKKINSMPCSKMWTDINLNVFEKSIRTCCFRWTGETSKKEIDNLGGDAFLSLPIIKQAKKTFLTTNSFPKGCEKCEANWDCRSKVYYNKWKFDSFDEEKLNALESKDLISTIEIFPGNICNLSCLYCNEDHSSKWASIKGKGKFIDEKWEQSMLSVLSSYLKKRWSKPDSPPIEFKFGGGEPFLNKSFDLFLDRILEINSDSKYAPDDCTIFVISNLSFDTKLLNKFIHRVTKYSSFKWVICGSIDAIGKPAENIRNGLDFNQFVKNLEFLATNKQIKLELLPTLSILSLPEAPKFFNWVFSFIEKNQISKNRFWVNAHQVTHPYPMHISALPKSYISYMEETIKMLEGTFLSNLINFYENIIDNIGVDRTVKRIYELEKFYIEMGALQKKDYFKLFPVLNKVLNLSL